MSKAILVTGGAGYIGSHLVLALKDRGLQPVVLDNLSSGSPDALWPDVPFVEGDIADKALVRQCIRDHGVGSVIHMAGLISVEESVADPMAYYAVNTSGAHRLIASCQCEGVANFIFSSTALVYRQPSPDALSERSPLGPMNPYGWSKFMTEQVLRDLAHAGTDMRLAILRYFNVAGADPDGRTGQRGRNATHLIKIASQLAAGLRDSMQIFGTDYDTPDGTCIRDYIHVTDLAEAHVAVLDWLGQQPKGLDKPATFNCGYGHGFSVRDVLEAVGRVHGTPIRASEAGRRPGDPAKLLSDPSRIQQVVGWRPRLDDLDGIVGSAMAWERSLTTQ